MKVKFCHTQNLCGYFPYSFAFNIQMKTVVQWFSLVIIKYMTQLDDKFETQWQFPLIVLSLSLYLNTAAQAVSLFLWWDIFSVESSTIIIHHPFSIFFFLLIVFSMGLLGALPHHYEVLHHLSVKLDSTRFNMIPLSFGIYRSLINPKFNLFFKTITLLEVLRPW